MSDPQPVILTVDQIKGIVADTVQETLEKLGVDVKDPLEMQRDFQTVRDFRVMLDAVKKWALRTVVVAAVTTGLAILALGIKAQVQQWMGGPGGGAPPAP